MDEYEKMESNVNANALAQIKALGLAQTMNPYSDFLKNISLAAIKLDTSSIMPNAEKIVNMIGLQQAFNPSALAMSKSIKAISESISSITSITSVVPSFVSSLQKIQSSLSSIVSSIDWNALTIPWLTEEEKQKRIDVYRRWGAYGWTVFPHVPYKELKLFREDPGSRTEANKKALSYFRTQKQMDTFWKEFDRLGKVRQCDFQEAIKDFDNRCYKSCAMVLYSLIDARLIRLQGGPKENVEEPQAKSKKKRYRYSGAAASGKIKKKYIEVHEKDLERMFFNNLSRENLFCAIDVLYENGDDFRIQPEIMNRNFVDHGMLHRKVRRMDCIQLFLAYYNFLTFENRLTAEDRKELKGIV